MNLKWFKVLPQYGWHVYKGKLGDVVLFTINKSSTGTEWRLNCFLPAMKNPLDENDNPEKLMQVAHDALQSWLEITGIQ